LGNIGPEDRKQPISVGFSPKSWKRIDKYRYEHGGMNRSEFLEKISIRYIDENEKSQDPNHNSMSSFNQINSSLGSLEAFLLLSTKEEVRKVLRKIQRINQLAENLSRTTKRDISKITEHDPIEKIRLESTRKAHEFRAQHEKPVNELQVPTPRCETNLDAEEIELTRLAQDTGNDISKRFGSRRTEVRQKPDLDIIEGEVNNRYGEGETVFQ